MFRVRRVSMLTLLMLSNLLLAGCGRSSSPGETTGENEEKPSAQRESAGTGAGGESESQSASAAKPLTPDDVWFDSPLKIAADTTPLGGGKSVAAAAAKAPDGAAAKPTGTADAPKPAATAGGGPETLVTGDMIANEIKQIKIEMKDLLSSESKYNGNYKKLIPMNVSVLAALASIAANHSENISWKADAKFVRDLAAEVGLKSKGLGKEHYEATMKAWEAAEGMVSGNKPPKLPESAPTVPYPEVVKRGPAMIRMERADVWMKDTITSADALKKQQEKLLHETALLALMTHIIAADGFADSDADEYKEYVKMMEQACKELNGAAASGDFAAFGTAREKVKQACEKCHASFRFGN